MTLVSLEEAGANLRGLIDRAEAGEEIVIARDGRPVAQIVPRHGEPPTAPRRRVGGQFAGKMWMSDDFDAPLPDEIARAFGMLDE